MSKRTFVLISKDDLKKKVLEAYSSKDDYDDYFDSSVLREKLAKDLKVNFSFENFEDSKSNFGPKALMGVNTLSNGLTFWGMCAGGDWEHPVFFLVYFDGKKLRAYIPTEGNPWNTTTKEAYGNNEEDDLKNAKKRWPELFKNSNSFESNDVDFDVSAMERDILERFEAVGGASIGDRIKNLTFYGTGDEAVELFQHACGFCYSLTGLGYTEEAETVYGWAKGMAEASAIDVKDHPEWKDDIRKGNWDHYRY